jgi:exodeoxyribonuclease V beta subunit
MTIPADAPFDLYGDLPTGRIAIEASAGTGKTFALAALATRFLAERDISPADLLIVTFTRAATAELRFRIREQMVEAAAALVGHEPYVGDSELVKHLASEDRDDRRDRLERAISEFDSASISTIHGFATQVRRTLGLSSAVDPDARLIVSSNELIAAASADALAAASGRPFRSEEFPKLNVVHAATKELMASPDVRLVPDGSDPKVLGCFELVREIVEDAAGRLRSRRVSEGTIGFDDVLIQLRRALQGDGSEAVASALKKRYKVVLIDEFQDTDRVQWGTFSALFGQTGSDGSLVLVGDPKQSIFRFRGADVSVYLDAVHSDPDLRRSTLSTNWRADGACLDALRTLLEGATFGHPQIGYVDVQSAPENRGRRMVDSAGASQSGLQVRAAIGAHLPSNGRGNPDMEAIGDMIVLDLVAHIRELLVGSRIPTSKQDPTLRNLRPSDIAVLITGWKDAHAVQSALVRQGVPAVVDGAGSVLKSEAASQLRILLYAMERPGDLRRVRAFALSWFERWSIERVATSDEVALAGLQDRLTAWVLRLGERSVAEVLTEVWAGTGVVANVLGAPDGDRNATDLDHLAELLHSGSPQGRSGVAGLVHLLDQAPDAEGDADADTDVTARRIESDAEAVQITTVWKAKGLEFPVVCLPGLWKKPVDRTALIYTDPATGERTLDVTKNGQWPDKKALEERKAIAASEEYAERLRILYVALTRARHHTAVWWAKNTNSRSNALTRLLLARDVDASLVVHALDPPNRKADKFTVPAEDATLATLARLAQNSNGTITATVMATRSAPLTSWIDPAIENEELPLLVAAFGVTPDRSVQRWSFTSMTAGLYLDGADPYDASGADSGADDEAAVEEEADRPERTGPADDAPTEGPFDLLNAGTAFGTFVHGVLEEVDFCSVSLDDDLDGAIRSQALRRGVDLGLLAPEGLNGVRLLVDGLRSAIGSPLGPLFGDLSLADLATSDRLDELGFDMRLGDGARHPSVQDVGRLVVDHLLPGHPLVSWAESLAGGAIAVELAGYLTGSIDLVARVADAERGDRFVVADYKTNRLTRPGIVTAADAYGPGRLVEAMAEHHYPLQALLYAVALHRYLRWRAPLAGVGTRVSGAAYLFVRGMTGPGVQLTDGQPHGVFTWEFPPNLVVRLSDLLAGRPVPGAGR